MNNAGVHAGAAVGPEIVDFGRRGVQQQGIVEEIARWLARHYRETLGFDASFEPGTRAEMAALLRAFDPDADGWWLARVAGEPVGSITVDGRRRAAGEALLRWFILAPAARGRGLGRPLLARALDFCREAGYRRVRLFTSPRFEAAVHLYQGAGFELVRAQAQRIWGVSVVAYTYELDLTPPPPADPMIGGQASRGSARLVERDGASEP